MIVLGFANAFEYVHFFVCVCVRAPMRVCVRVCLRKKVRELVDVNALSYFSGPVCVNKVAAGLQSGLCKHRKLEKAARHFNVKTGNTGVTSFDI